MIKHKFTKQKLRAWIKEEKMSAKEYDSYGLYTVADDERRHAKILQEILKELNKGKEITRYIIDSAE
jgi:rubrerythrin